MTDVNTLNERTRLLALHKQTGDRLVALLVAVYKLPLEQRKIVLEQYEENYERIAKGKEAAQAAKLIEEETDEKFDCKTCRDERVVEVLGDGDNFEVDVVGYKPCPDCKWEDPIQD